MLEISDPKPYHGIILTGPTASGKSKAALDLAEALDGEIINADSMQVYAHLPILTAHPSQADFDRIPHHLYGVLHHQEKGSVGWWYPQACAKIDEILQNNKVPLIVGGTGMYLTALLKGLAKIPDIPEAIRDQVRAWAKEENFFDRVNAHDPEATARLHPQDKQRLSRALEVWLSTGKSIYHWHQQTVKIRDYHFLVLVIMPERSTLYHRIDDRFLLMIDQGVLEEVRHFHTLNIAPDVPIAKAVGLPELQGYLNQETDLKSAIESAQQASRQYAKRQITWIRHQLSHGQIYANWSLDVCNTVVKDFFTNKSII
jgi:tRNA dimethylallyltransferase